MFAHERRDPASDLSHWIGPLSPAFAAMHADDGGSDGRPAAQSGAGAASAANRQVEWLGGPAPAPDPATDPEASAAELRALFHTLNNQLGVVITYAELIEAKAQDEAQRARANQVLTAALEALGTSRQIRHNVIR
jgi:hypothetical protein